MAVHLRAMAISAAIGVACLYAIPARAIDLSLWIDGYHAPGSAFAEVGGSGAWRPFAIVQIKNKCRGEVACDSKYGGGVAYRWKLSSRLSGQLGLVYLENINEVNGTELNAFMRLEFLINRHSSTHITHISHGSKLGIRKDAPNDGWNGVGFSALDIF